MVQGTQSEASMRDEKTMRLAIIFRNPQPARQTEYPDGWILFSGAQQFNVVVRHDGGRHPRVVRKEAA
jgi:hypothetical protein